MFLNKHLSAAPCLVCYRARDKDITGRIYVNPTSRHLWPAIPFSDLAQRKRAVLLVSPEMSRVALATSRLSFPRREEASLRKNSENVTARLL